MNVQRRTLLKSTLGGLAAYSLFPRPSFAAAAAPGTAPKRVVLIPFRGGLDGLELVVPYDASRYGVNPTGMTTNFHDRRSSIKITQTPNDLGDQTGLGFHPDMLELKGLWDDGDCAILHQVGWPEENQSHFYSQDRNAAARNLTSGHTSGWVTRAATQCSLSTTEVAATGIGSVIDIRVDNDSTFNPLSVRDLDSFQLPNTSPAEDRLYARNKAGKEAEGLITSTNTIVSAHHQGNQSAFELLDDITSGIAAYPGQSGSYAGDSLGTNLYNLARLLSGGAFFSPWRFAVTFSGGFDTHASQNDALGKHLVNGVSVPGLLTTMDQNLAAFVDDLKLLGEFDNTLIVLYTEFGRRIAQNSNGGTDHGNGNNVLLIGGGVNGGKTGGGHSGNCQGITCSAGGHFGVFHKDTLPGILASHSNMPVTMDFRHLFETILGSWMGMNSTDVAAVLNDPSAPGYQPSLAGLFL